MQISFDLEKKWKSDRKTKKERTVNDFRRQTFSEFRYEQLLRVDGDSVRPIS